MLLCSFVMLTARHWHMSWRIQDFRLRARSSASIEAAVLRAVRFEKGCPLPYGEGCGEGLQKIFGFLGRLRSVDLITWVICPSVRPSVRPYIRRPQKVFPIPMKFGMQVEVDEWCRTVCRMTRSKVKVKVTRPLKLEILQFSKSISSGIFNESWQVTTGSETTEQYLTFVRSRFLMSVLVFVSRDFELGRVSVQFANALQLQ